MGGGFFSSPGIWRKTPVLRAAIGFSSPAGSFPRLCRVCGAGAGHSRHSLLPGSPFETSSTCFVSAKHATVFIKPHHCGIFNGNRSQS
jgi:hypothetical protein